MSNQGVLVLALVMAVLIIVPLAFYAGKLLFQLKHQTQKQNSIRRARIETITESIQTIAMAVEQQQCNLSEGAIRLTNLLESLPVEQLPDWSKQFPATYELYAQVKDLPTHEARKALAKEQREQQDKLREEHEARLESQMLKEMQSLRAFTI